MIEKIGYTAVIVGIVIYFTLLVAALLVDQRPRWRVSEWVTKCVLSRTTGGGREPDSAWGGQTVA